MEYKVSLLFLLIDKKHTEYIQTYSKLCKEELVDMHVLCTPYIYVLHIYSVHII